MSVAAPAHPALKLCGFTQDELDDLLKEASFNPTAPALFSNYFFNNVMGAAMLRWDAEVS